MRSQGTIFLARKMSRVRAANGFRLKLPALVRETILQIRVQNRVDTKHSRDEYSENGGEPDVHASDLARGYLSDPA